MSPVIRKKGERFTIPGKYLLFLLAFFCVAGIVVSFRSDMLSEPANALAGTFVVPVQKGISRVSTAILDKGRQFQEVRSLQEENAMLKEQLFELTNAYTSLGQDKYELTRLRNLYKLDGQYPEYPKIGARIIAKDTGNWYHIFVIDKGTDEGLAVDMNILAGNGLVGRIIDVGPDWAKVQSVIADNSSVSGMVLSTQDNLIVTGNLESYSTGVIRFSKLVDTADNVRVGDKIVTSNISDKYLPGILIGYITSVDDDSNNLTKSGTLSPAVDFEHLSEVLVVLTQKSDSYNESSGKTSR